MSSQYLPKDLSQVHRWLRSNPHRLPAAKTIDASLSNNAVDFPAASPPRSIDHHLRQQLNDWFCLQTLYNHRHFCTLSMSLSNIARAVLSNSHGIFTLSAYIRPFLQRQPSSQVNAAPLLPLPDICQADLERGNAFVSLPALVNRYGIAAVLNLSSSIELDEHMQSAMKQSDLLRRLLNYPPTKAVIIRACERTVE